MLTDGVPLSVTLDVPDSATATGDCAVLAIVTEPLTGIGEVFGFVTFTGCAYGVVCARSENIPSVTIAAAIAALLLK
jgi:hypothetical protein